jgi:hypothetical protein
MPTIEEDIALINSVWGSEALAIQALQSQAQELCQQICGKHASIPEIQIRPSMMAYGTIIRSGLRSAEYEPSDDGSTPIIALFPSALDNKDLARIAIAHELIHHWENECDTADSKRAYPTEADTILASIFSSEAKMKKWRSGHSKIFIAKAAEVAKLINASLQQMLVHR